MKSWRAVPWLLAIAAAVAAGALLWGVPSRLGTLAEEAARRSPVATPGPKTSLARVAALGRIEPRHGVRRVAGPPRPAVVIEALRVEEGDAVTEGQILAVLAGAGVQRAEVARLAAELANAESELERNRQLFRDGVLSSSEWESLGFARDVARAALASARAELELSEVRSPIDGQVLEIHAREGERVGPDGVAELGETSAMYAVAEVYETDIGRVRVGQRARIRSPALPRELEGEVERIGLKIGKKDVLSTDPVADADARVVEVEIRLREPALAASLTNLRVEVVIEP
jgi:multidrug efflux pump subunit AcrA (membrane-fusion protein)